MKHKLTQNSLDENVWQIISYSIHNVSGLDALEMYLFQSTTETKRERNGWFRH